MPDQSELLKYDTCGAEIAKGSAWGKWYLPGSNDDDQIYDGALQKCKEVNDQLNSQPWWDNERGFLVSRTDKNTAQLPRPGLYNASWLQELIKKEKTNINNKTSSDSAWRHKISGFADEVIRVATLMKPVVDLFVPSSPEYSVPYACLWVVFKGLSARKEKKGSVFGLVASLSDEVPILQAYENMFPTNEMKELLAQFYIHTVDLLWRLARYYSIGFIKQLTDAILPRTKYSFPTYLENIKMVSKRLRDLCDIGHMAEQKDIKFNMEILQSEVRHLRLHLDTTRDAQAQHYASDVIDTWHDEIEDVEYEDQLWKSLHFSTEMRDHWSQNGILPCIAEWRQKCDTSENSVLWISSQGNGRQSWLTEFSLDLINVCKSQSHTVIAAMCDRPRGVKWTPTRLIRQLIAQLLIDQPILTISQPRVFNCRNFRRASTFDALTLLLNSCVAALKSALIIIDRIDLCVPGQNDEDEDIVQALSQLVRTYPDNLRVIITSGQLVSPRTFADLPISFAMVNTRRRPRRRDSPSPSPPPKPKERRRVYHR